jgi:hypothetical protein
MELKWPNFYLKKKKNTVRGRGVAHVVKHLLSKHKALSSNPVPQTNKETKYCKFSGKAQIYFITHIFRSFIINELMQA